MKRHLNLGNASAGNSTNPIYILRTHPSVCVRAGSPPNSQALNCIPSIIRSNLVPLSSSVWLMQEVHLSGYHETPSLSHYLNRWEKPYPISRSIYEI